MPGNAHGLFSAFLAAERGPQPVLADPPEIVLHAVNQRHRDLLAVRQQVILRLSDLAFLPRHALLAGDAGDDRPGVVAQMTARPGEQGDDPRPGRHRSARHGSRCDPWPRLAVPPPVTAADAIRGPGGPSRRQARPLGGPVSRSAAERRGETLARCNPSSITFVASTYGRLSTSNFAM